MSVILDKLQDSLSSIDVNKSIYIAYSGGIDSTVLLHATNIACQQSNHSLTAIHINHQIHANSSQWAEHCIEQCRKLNIEINTICVDVEQFSQQGGEGAARDARYEAFENTLDGLDVLFTAHHADDQIETMLLQLFRGAGAHGLASCAQTRTLGNALLIRPLLEISRQQIEHYAEQNQLQWCDDPSNDYLVHDRNYLRHEVMPLLHTRWQGLRETIGRSSQWQSESSQMLDSLAEQDAKEAVDEDHRLSIKELVILDNVRLKNVLRWWIRTAGYLLPNADVLDSIIKDAVHSRSDCEARIRWQNYEIRKYRDQLYLQTVNMDHDATLSYQWDLQQPLTLPELDLILTRQQLDHFGVNLSKVEQLTVSFRRGGEVMRPRGRGCQKELKTLFQEQGVEPWERNRIPLIFHNQQLIFVWGYWIGEGY
ncbi:MAG: tRNA lysidine(34) synthetase TilS [Gammaproteobacteria bacterium]